MLPINYNYSDLEKQLRNLGVEFLKCKTVEERLLFYSTYESLVDVYCCQTGCDFSNKKIYRSYLKDSALVDTLGNYHFESVIKYQDFHRELMRLCYDGLNSFFQEVCDCSFCGSLLKKDIPTINEGENEDRELVEKFLLEKTPHLFSFYQELVRSGGIYPYDGDLFRDGLTQINLPLKKANVFIPSENPSLGLLSALPHELGHYEEFQQLLNSCSMLDSLEYFSSSLLAEVNSTYYEQMFIEFYMNRGNHRENSFLSMIDFFDSGLNKILDSYILSSLPIEEFQKLQDTDMELLPTEENFCSLENLEYSDFFEKSRIGGVDSFIYAYGFLLSTYFLENPDRYHLFQENKREVLSPEWLESMDITPEKMSKTLVKRGEHLFGKYMD